MQRQRFPASACWISSRSGRGFRSRSAFRGEKDSRRAVPALRRAHLGERDLKRMSAAVFRHSLDGENRSTPEARWEARDRRARARRRRARCRSRTRPSSQPCLVPVSLQVLSQDFEKRLVRRNGDLLELGVDPKPQHDVLAHDRYCTTRAETSRHVRYDGRDERARFCFLRALLPESGASRGERRSSARAPDGGAHQRRARGPRVTSASRLSPALADVGACVQRAGWPGA